MLLISFYRIYKTALVSFWRNRWLSLAATLIMILTLITISFFVGMLVVTNKTTETLKSKVDMSVYFNDSTSKDQIFALQNILLARSDIKSVDYISKEQALALWRERNEDNQPIRDIISDENNPLPRSLGIKTENPDDLETINTFLNSSDYQPLVKEISYKKNKNLIDRLVRISAFVKVTGWSLSLVFVLISLLVTYNTVRLTIFARKEEIEIMKLVGASDLHVKGPFIIEGVTYGLIGAVIASIIFSLILKLALPSVESYLGAAITSPIYSIFNYGLIFLAQLAVGLILGVLCSVTAIKKHLN